MADSRRLAADRRDRPDPRLLETLRWIAERVFPLDASRGFETVRVPPPGADGERFRAYCAAAMEALAASPRWPLLRQAHALVEPLHDACADRGRAVKVTPEQGHELRSVVVVAERLASERAVRWAAHDTSRLIEDLNRATRDRDARARALRRIWVATCTSMSAVHALRLAVTDARGATPDAWWTFAERSNDADKAANAVALRIALGRATLPLTDEELADRVSAELRRMQPPPLSSRKSWDRIRVRDDNETVEFDDELVVLRSTADGKMLRMLVGAAGAGVKADTLEKGAGARPTRCLPRIVRASEALGALIEAPGRSGRGWRLRPK